MTLFIHEIKMNFKNFLIWFISVVVLCGGCIFLFPFVKDSMKEMADSYSDMGGFSVAFGLDKLSIASMDGFFATQIGTMYSLGAAMFAALLGIGILSKEEYGHTSEFLHTLPLGRYRIITSKLVATTALITLFDLLHFFVFTLAFVCVGEHVNLHLIIVYMLTQYLMHLEVAGICFAISSIYKRNQFGLGLGLTLILYMLDLISRITESMDNLKYITPFYYSNASDVFGNSGDINSSLIVIACSIIGISIIIAYIIYGKKDITA